MLRKDLLKRWIAQNQLTLAEVAHGLEVTPRTLYNRLRRGNFREEEMARLIRLLHITNPCEVFFNIKES